MKSYDPAAGVVVLKFKDGDWNVLFLKTKKGKYDLTKGIIDVNESSFDAAVRETYEEAGIDELDFGRFGKNPIETDRCTMYVAVTTQEPEIKPNPASGIYEHTGYVWMPMIDAINTDKLPKFLEPAVDYAYDLVRNAKE